MKNFSIVMVLLLITLPVYTNAMSLAAPKLPTIYKGDMHPLPTIDLSAPVQSEPQPVGLKARLNTLFRTLFAPPPIYNSGVGIIEKLMHLRPEVAARFHGRSPEPTSPSSPSFSATPTEGVAPLSVDFSASLPLAGEDCNFDNLQVDYGDGDAVVLGAYFEKGDDCRSLHWNRLYREPGKHVVQLIDTSAAKKYCTPQSCPQSLYVTVGQVTIDIGGTQASPLTSYGVYNGASAKIDEESLATSDRIPTITGDAHGVREIEVWFETEDGLVLHTESGPVVNDRFSITAKAELMRPIVVKVHEPGKPFLASGTLWKKISPFSPEIIHKADVPSTVAMKEQHMGEVRSRSFYFGVQDIGGSSALVSISPVGTCPTFYPSDPPPDDTSCIPDWNNFPSATLKIGESLDYQKTRLTLTSIANGVANISITAKP